MIIVILSLCCAGLAAFTTWHTAMDGHWALSVVWGIISAIWTALAMGKIIDWLYKIRKGGLQ